MRANFLETLPEAFVSSTEMSAQVSRAVRAGQLRKLASRLYTRNLVDTPEEITRRHLWSLLADFVPGALIADRTALELAPADDGSVFIVSDRDKDLILPGSIIRSRKGAAAQPDDQPFMGQDLRLSSQARGFLDNLVPSRRSKTGVSRTLRRSDIEARLDDLARTGGEASLNRLRDEARRLAPLIDRQSEFVDLDALIGALLGTRDTTLRDTGARARAVGQAYDPRRLERLQRLSRELQSTAPVVRPARELTPEGRSSLAFFEAYFSNFIEGTEFDVDEAADIVFRNAIPRDRPADAHDVQGTWRIVSDLVEMSRRPRNADEMISLLKSRHRTLMSARPEKSPGEFKRRGNRAGATIFVSPDEVEGTLRRGFDLYQTLDTAFARGVYMMFLVAEVHPFADGNGRMARIMMNAELVGAGEERILVPTIYRSNYLSALRALSGVDNPTPLVRTLNFAQRWVGSIEWRDVASTVQTLEATHAFMDPNQADDDGVRLRLGTQRED